MVNGKRKNDIKRNTTTMSESEVKNLMTAQVNERSVQIRFSSDAARSAGGLVNLAAGPQHERAPLMDWMAERRSEKVSLLRSQDIVEL